jgi:hypothetical protein
MNTKRLARRSAVKAVPVALFGLLAVVLLFIFVLLPLFGPFGSVSVPEGCTDQASHLPASREYTVPGIGTGALLVENAEIATIVIANYGQSPFYTHVYVVNRHTKQVASSFDFATNVIDAGFDDKTLYLFNDKLGHFVSAMTGESIHYVVTSDNYRGLYEPNRVQSDLTISGITTDHTFIFRHYMHMSNIVHGCYLS